MDSSQDRVPDGKPRRRSGGSGGSKKSTRHHSSRADAGVVAGSGGDRSQVYNGAPGESNAEWAAHSDHPTSGAQVKDPMMQSNSRHDNLRAKGSRRTSGTVNRSGDGGRRGGGERSERAQHQQLAETLVADPVGSLDKAILERWRTEASTAAEKGRKTVSKLQPAIAQNTPEEVVEDENVYGDESFEEYSDEFEGEGDEGPSSAGAVELSATHRVSSRGTGAGTGGGAGLRTPGSRVMSPALKMRQANEVQAPDDKVLQELRHSLREENDIARERKIAGPSTEEISTADGKTAGRVVRGAKGSKGSKGIAAAASAGQGIDDAIVPRGQFSVDASADAKGSTRKKRSSFRMADAKALTRALARGDPRTKRILAIRSSSRLEVESVRLFDQPPMAPIDLYHWRLRAQPALIRQVASQTNEDARTVEAQTDEILRANKEVQFHLGHDDTELENLMRRLRSARQPSRRQVGQEKKESDGDEKTSGESNLTMEDATGSTTIFKGICGGQELGDTPLPLGLTSLAAPLHDGGIETSEGSLPAPQRLGKFLRQACVVMETLCEENLQCAASKGQEGHLGVGGRGPLDPDEEGDGKDGRSSIFLTAVGKGWEELGSGVIHFESIDGVSNMGAPKAPEQEEQRDTSLKLRAHNGWRSLLEGVDVVGVIFSRAKRSMLVTAHARQTQSWNSSGRETSGAGGERESGLEGCGVVCVWNAETATAAPVGVLFGEGLFSCLCLAQHQPHVVLAGTAEGCLLLWDMRDPAASNRAEESRKLGLQCGLRSPTYTTAGGGGVGSGAGLADPGYGHASTVVSITAIPIPEGGMEGGGIGEMMSLQENNSFQVASLDDRGIVSIWLVTEVPRVDEGGSQTDLGLSPGGRVRLTLSKSLRPGSGSGRSMWGRKGSTLFTQSFDAAGATPASATSVGTSITSTLVAVAQEATAALSLAFSPDNPNRFLIGASSDQVLHASRLGDPPLPREYRAPNRCFWGGLKSTLEGDGLGLKSSRHRPGEEEGTMGGVNCLGFSPFFRKYFLAGYGDGSLRLYKDDCAVPLIGWEGFSSPAPSTAGFGSGTWPAGISSIAWSNHRPAVFFALDTTGTLHAFDVLENDSGPAMSEPTPANAFGLKRGRERAECVLDQRVCNDSPRRGSCRDEEEKRRAIGDLEDRGSSVLDVWAPPGLSLSSARLATGSRPRVAVSIGGRAFTRVLSRQMFWPPSATLSSGSDGREEGVVQARRDNTLPEVGTNFDDEKKQMEDWLRTVL